MILEYILSFCVLSLHFLLPIVWYIFFYPGGLLSTDLFPNSVLQNQPAYNLACIFNLLRIGFHYNLCVFVPLCLTLFHALLQMTK